MSELNNKPKILVSDPKVLHKIKYMQFRRQAIPLALVVIILVVNIIIPYKPLLYPTLAAFLWYLLERMFFRTKNKIAAPEEGTFVSPVDGKVQSIHKSGEATLLTLRKSWLDNVEFRLAHPDFQRLDDNNWNLDTPSGTVSMRMNASKINYIEVDQVHGAVVGVIPGSVIITFHIPAGLKVQVSDKQNVFGGETVLFSLSENSVDV